MQLLSWVALLQQPTVLQATTEWRRHVALADRGLPAAAGHLNNVIGCHGVSWNTDHHHCPWNSLASAQPTNQTCISSSPAEVLASTQNATLEQPGRPVVFTLSEISDPTIPGPEAFADHTANGYYTPFLDTWVQGLTLRVRLWFAEYKRLGGHLDVVLLDFEACDYLNAGRMATQQNSMGQSNFGSEIVKMSQWPSLRAELEALGKVHDVSFSDSDMAEMKSWGQNQTDFRQYVWNAVVVSLTTARALNSSIAEPILALFPNAHISNYAHNYHVAGPGLQTGEAGCCNWAYHFSEERHSVAFGGTHVGTHASHSAYGLGTGDRSNPWWNSSQILSTSTPWWQTSVSNTAFNNLIHDVRLARNAKAGTPSHVGYHPYIKPKVAQRPLKPPGGDPHASGQDGIYGDSDLYQEHLLHIMLSAATREVATWNFEFSASANVLLSKCLLELDTVFNVSASPASASIQTGTYGTDLAFDADFVLSGAIAIPETQQHTLHEIQDSSGVGSRSSFSRRVVYRVTFRDPAVIPVQNQNGAPARFTSVTPAEIVEGKLGYVSTPIEGATLLLLPPTPISNCTLTLEHLCAADKEVGAVACGECAGAHAAALHTSDAHCSNTQIHSWCMATANRCKQPSDGKPRCPRGQCDIAGHCKVPVPESECSTRGYWLEMTTK